MKALCLHLITQLVGYANSFFGWCSPARFSFFFAGGDMVDVGDVLPVGFRF
jgi:hypothetical protein